MPRCTHSDTIHVDAVPAAERPGLVCAACVAMGSSWVHLRQCRTCGNVACCDDSPNRHARAHAEGEGHPIITSAQPQEGWSYCYADMLTFEIEDGRIVGEVEG